ncbi:MAG TPA: glycosyltransferase family 39 protein [Patescibacteria group bacterium]|nr:glycosyltransferase family 39 protein [Patescibacteria group bacterium]
MNKYILILLLLLAISLGIFLRAYKFGAIPTGLLNDEADFLYDAYSFLHTGHDQWGNPPGLFLKGFGDYRPAFSTTYILMPFVALFGLTQFAVRVPPFLAGVFAIPLVYLFVKKLFNNVAALFASFLLATLPWAVGISRINTEATLGVCLLLCGLNFLIRWKINKYFLPIAIVFLSLCMYTYSAYALFIPIVILVSFLFYRKQFLQRKLLILFSASLFIVCVAPLLLLGNMTANTRFSQVGMFQNVNSIGIINKVNAKRGSCMKEYPVFFCKIIMEKPRSFATQFFINYLHHFSLYYIYIDGTTTQYALLPPRNLAYLIELPLFILGIVFIITTKKEKQLMFPFLLLLFAPVADALTGDGHYARSSPMIPFLVTVEAIGAYSLTQRIRSMKSIFFKKSLITIFLFWYIASIGLFFISYTTYFPDYYGYFSQYGYQELMTSISKKRSHYDRIYISDYLNDTKQYIYYLVYAKYNPKQYQLSSTKSFHIEQGGWISVDRIDNIYFVHNLPLIKNMQGKKILLVSNPKEFPSTIKPDTIIYDRLHHPIFYEIAFSY